MGIKTI